MCVSSKIPALLIKTSRTPNSFSIWATAAAMEASELSSSWTEEAAYPSAVRVAAASFPAASLREPICNELAL